MYQEKIAAAAASQQEWVLLEEEGQAERGGVFRRLEMHLATGVAVLAAAERKRDGSLQYRTESFFVNRKTGMDLPCGSRKWNVGLFDNYEQLQAAVTAAKEDVYTRFPGLIKIARRQRA